MPASTPRRTPTGSRPAAASRWTSQPDVVLLPWVPATATSVRPNAASATTCCHGSSGIPAARAAASSGLSGSMAVSALVTARRSGCGERVTCAGSWRACEHDPERVERRRIRRGSGRVATRHHGTRPSGEQRGRAGAGAGRADDVDALEHSDGTGRPGRLEAGPDPLGGRGHAEASTRSSRRLSAAAALRRLFVLRSPLHRWRLTATPTESATAM